MSAASNKIDMLHAPIAGPRIRLVHLIVAFFVAVVVFLAMFSICFAFVTPIYNFLLQPYADAVGDPETAKLIFTSPPEYFHTKIVIGVYGASFMAVPVGALLIYRFFILRFYKGERRWLMPLFFAVPVLFIAGAGVAYFVDIPLLMKYAVEMQKPTSSDVPYISFTPRTSEYFSVAIEKIFKFGLGFQIPVILFLLVKVVKRVLRGKRDWVRL